MTRVMNVIQNFDIASLSDFKPVGGGGFFSSKAYKNEWKWEIPLLFL